MKKLVCVLAVFFYPFYLLNDAVSWFFDEFCVSIEDKIIDWKIKRDLGKK